MIASCAETTAQRTPARKPALYGDQTMQTTPRPYRGKYPHRIKSVSYGGKGSPVWMMSNDGHTLKCDRRLLVAGNAGNVPRIGQDIREFQAYAVAE
jgi:hypothetical protein